MTIKERRETWDEYFMGLCRNIAARSKDKRTKVGAIAVGPDKEVRSMGYNGFARGIDDSIEERYEILEKSLWMAHAEENVITNAARVGIPLKGCTMYVASISRNGAHPPCAPCTRMMIQSGIVRIVYEAGEVSLTYKDHTRVSRVMTKEAKVKTEMV